MPRKNRNKTDRRNAKHKPVDVPPQFEPGFLQKLDGRTQAAKLLKQTYAEIVADLGGEETLSHFQRSLSERAVYMEAMIRKYEHQLATTDDEEKAEAITGKWTQMVNAYSGLVARLGLERESSAKPWAIEAITDDAGELDDANTEDDR